MEIKDTLIEKIKSEMIEVGKPIYSQEEMDSFLEWMKIEYINYMVITRKTALETLQKLKDVYEYYIPLVEILENNIDEYASLQCYYQVALNGVTIK